MAEMKNPREPRTIHRHSNSARGDAALRMYHDELTDASEDLSHGVPYPTNAHPEQTYMDMTRLQPMPQIIKDRGDGDYEVITPAPSLSQQVREQVLTSNTGSFGRAHSMTFNSALKKETR